MDENERLISFLSLLKKTQEHQSVSLFLHSPPFLDSGEDPKMAAMIRHFRQGKAANTVAGLMGSLKVRPFCIVTPAPTLTAASALPPIATAAADADQGRVSASMDEKAAAVRRQRKRGGYKLLHGAPESKQIKELAMFGLDQINQREQTNLELVRVLGAWSGPKHDITLEATDGGGKGKFYRVGVTNLCMFKPFTYDKLKLVQWELLDDPYPITRFKPGDYTGQALF